ncbi:hypothetical protein P8452_61127 [Trifolium repens]|nr:hypothetical protein P8452_61127 [Trifolium repens]
MKGAIRDQLREIAFPETTSLKAPKENVAPKGGKKKRVAKERATVLLHHKTQSPSFSFSCRSPSTFCSSSIRWELTIYEIS